MLTTTRNTHAMRPRFAARTGWPVIALAVAALLLLAACDGGENGDENGDGGTTSAAPTSEAATTPPSAATSPASPAAPTTAAPAAPDAPAPAPDPATTADPTVAVATEGEHAPYLVDGEGMTLYLFTNDTEGVSNCTGGCLANWPPLLVADGEEPVAGEGVTGDLDVIERTDGEGRQVTYDGMPLYYWAADRAPGDTTGHGVGGVWFVVPPSEDASSTSSSTTDSGY